MEFGETQNGELEKSLDFICRLFLAPPFAFYEIQYMKVKRVCMNK